MERSPILLFFFLLGTLFVLVVGIACFRKGRGLLRELGDPQKSAELRASGAQVGQLLIAWTLLIVAFGIGCCFANLAFTWQF